MPILKFQGFELDTGKRILSSAGQPLQIGSRAFDILVALASRPGTVVTTSELLQIVWPTTTVQEGALRVHMVALRRVLKAVDQDVIHNVPGRGYLFSAVAQGAAGRDDAHDVQASVLGKCRPRRNLRPLVGRSEFIAKTSTLVLAQRLVTIAGSPGVGKTAVALECARIAMEEGKRVLFFDLSEMSADSSVFGFLAGAMGILAAPDQAKEAVINELAGTEQLVILDSCERVVDDAARSVEELLMACDGTSVLATSREPLLLASENIRRLPPLDPGCCDDNRPGLRLFLDLVNLTNDQIDTDDKKSRSVAGDIVKKLDGVPLALELAAARTRDLDLVSLNTGLSRSLSILRRGHRTAPRRHQSLCAALDWSFESLSPSERQLLFQLERCTGSFTANSVSAQVDWSTGDRFQEAFEGLYLKSLLVPGAAPGEFRLLSVTRSYLREKRARYQSNSGMGADAGPAGFATSPAQRSCKTRFALAATPESSSRDLVFSPAHPN